VRALASTEPVKAILFDVDGTLLDGLDMIVAGLGDSFEKFGTRRPSDDEILALIGTPLTHQMKLFGCSPKNQEELDEMIQYTIDRYEAHHHLEAEFTEAVQGLVMAAKAGIGIALVTSRNAQELKNLKSRFSAWEHIDHAVCASDVENPKPHEESAHLAMAKLGATPEESVLIGDSIFDLRCAKSAGIRCGAALYGAGKKEDLLAEAPDYIFTTPMDLLEWVHNIVEQSHAKEEDLRPTDFQSRRNKG
jgi:pyrophosphatase PpaX